MPSSSVKQATLVLSFAYPAGTFVSDRVLDTRPGVPARIAVNGARWYYEDTPLIVPADILYESITNFFIGLTFPIIAPEWQLPALCQMLKTLDRSVVRVTDYRLPTVRAAYPEACRSIPYLEILWYPCANYSYRLAQLEYGAWRFGYPNANPSLFRDPN